MPHTQQKTAAAEQLAAPRAGEEGGDSGVGAAGGDGGERDGAEGLGVKWLNRSAECNGEFGTTQKTTPRRAVRLWYGKMWDLGGLQCLAGPHPHIGYDSSRYPSGRRLRNRWEAAKHLGPTGSPTFPPIP